MDLARLVERLTAAILRLRVGDAMVDPDLMDDALIAVCAENDFLRREIEDYKRNLGWANDRADRFAVRWRELRDENAELRDAYEDFRVLETMRIAAAAVEVRIALREDN
jgi:hypothetical protein